MGTSDRPPNVLFLMSDQHRADVSGYEGNPVIRTPVLDELARTGVVFRNAYTPSPICIPGRQCLMSGQLPETCGCRNFGEDVPPGHMTWARRFSEYAYKTVCSGKLHHMGTDQMQGWTNRIAPDCALGDNFIEGRNEEAFARYTAAPGTGKWTNQKETERAGIGYGPYQRFDDRATQAATDFVEGFFCDSFYDRPGSHRPLLLKLSLLQPHYPFFTGESKFTYYLNRVPLYQEEPSSHPRLGKNQAGPLFPFSERTVRRTTAAYYGMIETTDTHFGSLLNALEHVGQDLNDWIIIYTSDHGEMLGQHGIWEKTQFYEASARVPLIIRWPRQFAPRVVTENVNLCDLFATLCDLCGLPTPGNRDSRSLVPLMRGDAANWNNETVSQIGAQNVMIKRDALKYQYYGPEIPEVLFDLEADPGETRSVLDEPRYADAIAAFRERLASLHHGPHADPHYRNASYRTD